MIDDLERAIEAMLFASDEPLDARQVAARLGDEMTPGEVRAIIQTIAARHAGSGIELVERGGRWHFQTPADLAYLLRREREEPRTLTRAGMEVLAIVAYHEPVSRAEIEAIRGVQTSKGTLDVLMEAGWVRFRGRRRSPGRPVTFGTTRDFLDHFGLEELRDLPGLEELKGAGLLSGRIPSNFQVPLPLGEDEMAEDEDPITQLDLEELGLLTPGGKEDE